MNADMDGIGYYDRAGMPISLESYLALLRTSGEDDPKRVAFDMVDGYAVSTVWLGLNHAFGNGPPLIFETMVFGVGGAFLEATADGPWSDYQDRYATEAEAVAGHAFIVAAMRAGETP